MGFFHQKKHIYSHWYILPMKLWILYHPLHLTLYLKPYPLIWYSYDDIQCMGGLVNKLPMHAWRTQEGMLGKNILCRTRVFCTFIVWCKLTHLHRCWRHLWHVYTNVSILWYYCKNVIIFPDGKVFTRRILYINTVR